MWMRRGRRQPSQSWKAFLRSHATGVAAMDLLVVPTIGFRHLYVLIILGRHRRRILSFGVTSHPTAQWIAREISDAFPRTEAPRHQIRDRDAVYCQVVTPRLKSMRHPRAADGAAIPVAERICRTNHRLIRRECLDHIVVLGEAHLRLSLRQDAPIHRPIQRFGRIISVRVLDALRHQYCRT
jgi:hypothetical protein